MLRFLLGEDVPPKVAEIGRGLGLEIQSIYELGRAGWTDDEQLRAAGQEGKVFVTYNRNDYLALTHQFFHEAQPHAGVLIIPWSLRRDRAAEIAHRLTAWSAEMEGKLGGAPLPPYTMDFLR